MALTFDWVHTMYTVEYWWASLHQFKVCSWWLFDEAEFPLANVHFIFTLSLFSFEWVLNVCMNLWSTFQKHYFTHDIDHSVPLDTNIAILHSSFFSHFHQQPVDFWQLFKTWPHAVINWLYRKQNHLWPSCLKRSRFSQQSIFPNLSLVDIFCG